jgi:protein-S-isoprenylcysteine O-methyltransferase Ste14
VCISISSPLIPLCCFSSVLAAFLLNHSREYHAALVAGLFEYLIEWYFFPSLKYPSSSLVMWIGFVIVVVGQFVRTLAMFTAASNFTHIVAESKAPNHQLVKHGIYTSVTRGQTEACEAQADTDAIVCALECMADRVLFVGVSCRRRCQSLSSSVVCRLVLVECRYANPTRESIVYNRVCSGILSLLQGSNQVSRHVRDRTALRACMLRQRSPIHCRLSTHTLTHRLVVSVDVVVYCCDSHEERALCNFFGDEYVQYQKQVPSGVPFIKGYQQ